MRCGGLDARAARRAPCCLGSGFFSLVDFALFIDLSSLRDIIFFVWASRAIVASAVFAAAPATA